jgi:tape measure domain-containing protein|nr:MAG TPA: tail tape measure protein [Caudoviricetes sp.]
MATLYFKVSSDYDEVIRLRKECEKLEAQLKKMDVNKSPAAAKALETQLASARQQMMGLVTEAAKAGAVMEHDFKNGIYSASQTVNNLSANITSQRGIIRQLQNELTLLKEKYRETVKSGGDTSGMSEQVKAQTNKLREQKDVLFGLTQQQAEARLTVKKLKDEYAAFKEEAGETVEANEKMSVSLTKVLGVIGGVTALKNFVTELVNVRGQFQQLEIAFSTMLKSKEKADKLMSELVDIAAKTPFDLQGVASSAKQMLAYGSSAESVGDELVMLGNVAAGVGSQLSEIAYLYGTLRTQGRAYATDIRQFAGRGIPIYEELAKVLGVTKDEVSGLVTAGKVGFKEVEQAFKNMTSESGIYYNLMQEQSKSLTGQLSNLGDAWDTMLNEIGKDTQGIASSGISAVKGLIENYETVGKVLLGLIATYGTYKTALIVTRITQDALTARMELAILVTKAQTVAQKALNLAMSVNPYAAIATVVVVTSAALLNYASNLDKCKKGIDAYNKSVEEAARKEAEHKEEIEKLLSVAQDEQSSTEDRKEALIRLEQKYPDIFKKYKTEADMLRDILNIKKQINEEDERRRNVSDQEELNRLNAEINKLNEAIKSVSQSGAGLSIQSLVNEKNNLIKQRDLKQEEVNKKRHDEILSDLSGYSNEQLQKEVDVRERLMKRLENAQKLGNSVKNGKILNGILPGIKTNEQLQAEKQAIERELNNRGKTNDETKNKKYWEDKKKEAEAARDALDVSEKNSEEWNRYTQQIQEAQSQIEKYSDSSTILKDAERQKKEQQQLAEELLQIRRTNQQNEINLMEDGAEKKRRQIELDYQKEIDEIKKQRKKWEDAQGGKLTSEQRDVLGNRASNAMQSREKGLAAITDTENQAAIEANERYLKNYGTFMQKRQAITDEYTRKISEATTQGDKDILQKEMEKALSSLDFEKLKQGINWELVFGDLDKVSKESLNKVKQQLRDFKNSDEYKNMAVDQKKVIDEALNNIQSTLIDKGGLLADLPEQLSELAQAQEKYNEAMKNGTDAQKEAATKKLNDAQKRQQNAQTNVQKSTDKTTSNLISLSNVITQLGSNSEISLSQIGNLAGDVVDVFTEAGSKIGGIIGAAFSLLDAIGTQGLDGFVSNLFGSVFRSIGGIWDTLTFGLIGNKESDPYLKEDLERLTISNQDLKASLDNLADKMDESAVADASGIYEQQKKNIEEMIANTQEMMQRSAAAYSNGFLGIGGTHSSNKRVNDAMSAEDWKRVSEAAGVSVTSASDFWNLTSEQMYNVANNATDLYSKIKQYADDGYENASQYMDSYIEYWKQLDELEDTYREKLTDTSFDTIRDEFKNQLLDMESDAEDFAEDFEKMMQQAVVESMMSDTYANRLKEWYKSFANSMTDGTLSSTEQSNLKSQWEQMVSDALAERNAIMQAMGWDSSSSEQQSASSRGFGTEMTHEDAGELSGRFTAVYESNLRIETAEQQQTVAITELRGSISSLIVQANGLYNIADETRTILANSYLELQQIRENTEDSAKYLKDIKADIAEVKHNTARL